MAGAVLDLLGDREKAARLGQSAMLAARRRFDVNRLIDDMDQLYRQLLDEKGIRGIAIAPGKARSENETVKI